MYYLLSENQEGGGTSIDDKNCYKLASIIAEKYLNLSKPSTSKGGSSSFPTNLWQPSSQLMPNVAETEDVPNKSNIVYPNAILKDDLNDNFDETQLLELVPKPYRLKAKSLLQKFDARADELTWNSSGIVFIDQVSIPNSNFYVIFPLLFKRKKSNNVIGFNDVALKIKIMGLEDFILTKNIVKKTNIASSQLDQNNDPEKNIPWWYIGD